VTKVRLVLIILLTLMIQNDSWGGKLYPYKAVPAYFDSDSDWEQVLSASSSLGIILINPQHGPGHHMKSSLKNKIDLARAKGIKVLGTIYTSFGSRPITEIKNDIDHYKDWYEVDGILLDESSDQIELLSFYEEIASYIRSTSGNFVMMNPGVYPSEGYIALADSTIVFEGSYSEYIDTFIPDWIWAYPTYKFSHLVYNAPDSISLNQTNQLALERNTDFLYVTNQTLPDPWKTVPQYWNLETFKDSKLNRVLTQVDFSTHGHITCFDSKKGSCTWNFHEASSKTFHLQF
jgi:hypothetical protein